MNIGDPRLTFSAIPKDIMGSGIAGAGGIFGKMAESLPALAQSALDVVKANPIDTNILTGYIDKFKTQINDFTETEFKKIDPAKLNTIYKEMEKKMPFITECDKQMVTAEAINMIKQAEVMVKHYASTDLPEVFIKKEIAALAIEDKLKEFTQSLQDLKVDPAEISAKVDAGFQEMAKEFPKMQEQLNAELQNLNAQLPNIQASIDQGMNEMMKGLGNITFTGFKI